MMFIEKSTKDIDVGSRIDLPGFRGVIVTDNTPEGVAVMWFDDQGQGPHHGVLPHGKVMAVAYHDERVKDQSWWDFHPDRTGKTGEI